jgi:hypothetical protein
LSSGLPGRRRRTSTQTVETGANCRDSWV